MSEELIFIGAIFGLAILWSLDRYRNSLQNEEEWNTSSIRWAINKYY